MGINRKGRAIDAIRDGGNTEYVIVRPESKFSLTNTLAGQNYFLRICEQVVLQ
jgi:hypothetical protein